MKRWDQARVASQRTPHKHSVLAPVGAPQEEQRPEPPDGYAVTPVSDYWTWYHRSSVTARGEAATRQEAVAACWAHFKEKQQRFPSLSAQPQYPLLPGWRLVVAPGFVDGALERNDLRARVWPVTINGKDVWTAGQVVNGVSDEPWAEERLGLTIWVTFSNPCQAMQYADARLLCTDALPPGWSFNQRLAAYKHTSGAEVRASSAGWRYWSGKDKHERCEPENAKATREEAMAAALGFEISGSGGCYWPEKAGRIVFHVGDNWPTREATALAVLQHG